jgi:hypothetical protein
VYIDPSGVVDTVTGIPVAGAKVTLLRSTVGTGPFAQVPNRSPLMSPANRRNPDHTTALGQFGWDVIGGFYRISAQHVGCQAVSGTGPAETRTYAVPPPVDNLLIKLRCPHLRRAATHLAMHFKVFESSMTVVTATVRGRRATGLITFTANGSRATLLLNPNTHAATFVLPGSGGHVSARYQGDGYNNPSAARATAP